MRCNRLIIGGHASLHDGMVHVQNFPIMWSTTWGLPQHGHDVLLIAEIRGRDIVMVKVFHGAERTGPEDDFYVIDLSDTE